MRRKVNNYNLYGSHAWYVPGVGGMFGLLLWFILGMVIGSIIQIILAFILPKEILSAYSMIIIYPVQFLPAMIYAGYKSRNNAVLAEGYALDSRNFGKMGLWGAIGITVLASLATMMVADLPNWWQMTLTRKSPHMSKFYELIMEAMKTMTGGPLWSSFLVVAIFAPIFEEWLCRGMILRGLMTKMKPVWAIVISALFFAAIHGNPWQALNAFIIGLVMGYVYYRTGSLLLTMLIHFVNNGSAVIMSNIGSIKDIDYLKDMFAPGTYAVIYVAAVLVLAGSMWLFSRIPLKNSWGNTDPVESLGSEQ